MKLFKKKLGWKDITLKQGLELAELKNKNLEPEEQIFEVASIVFGKDVLDLPVNQFMKKVAELEFLKDEVPDTELKKKYVLNGTEYICQSDLTSMTTALFVDYNNLVKSKEMNKILAVFFRPSNYSKYNEGYDMNKVMEDMLYLDYASANSLSFFFKTQFELLLNLSQLYLVQLIMKDKSMTKEQKNKMIVSLTQMNLDSLVSLAIS